MQRLSLTNLTVQDNVQSAEHPEVLQRCCLKLYDQAAGSCCVLIAVALLLNMPLPVLEKIYGAGVGC